MKTNKTIFLNKFQTKKLGQRKELTGRHTYCREYKSELTLKIRWVAKKGPSALKATLLALCLFFRMDLSKTFLNGVCCPYGPTQSFFEWLKKQGEARAKICSVCTGAYLMGIAGLLDNKECTTHWKYLDDFKQRFPDTEVLTDRLIVKDDNIYSSAGVSSGIDLSLFIIEELFGAVFASKIAKEVVIYARRTSKDPQLSIYLRYRNHLENRIHEVQDILSQNLDKKIKIEELAEMVHMSRRRKGER
mgnify:CR=1 FL=1